MLVSEAFEQYRRDVIVFSNQSPKTEESHLICMRGFIAFAGDIQVEDLEFEIVRKWKEQLSTTRSPLTVRGYIIKLRVVLAFLKSRGIESLDPATVPLPKRINQVPTFCTPDEVETLIAATKVVRNKAIISLLYASGIRVSELCSLNRDSIKEGTFTIIGKGGKARLCFIDQRTEDYVQKYLDARSDNNSALFLSTQNKLRISPGNVQEIFRYARKRSGLESVHPHTMRHSFATNLLRNNANMRYVQVMLGHESLQTTQIYSHVVDTDLQRVYREYHTV
jgi:integrase/recombinase XerD